MTPIRFTPVHRAELLRLGLVPESIDQMEIDALPRSRAFLRRRPPRTAVLDELKTVARAIDDAHAAIERLLNATEAAPPRVSARSLVLGGGRRHVMDGIVLNRITHGLLDAKRAIADATARLPPGPVRHHLADPYPVELINNSLQLGRIFANLEPLCPKLKPSVSPTSPFRRMVGICYEAIGTASADPERALKAYVKDWRALAKVIERMETGQNVPRESDVPS